jgi:hypothetical protein
MMGSRWWAAGVLLALGSIGAACQVEPVRVAADTPDAAIDRGAEAVNPEPARRGAGPAEPLAPPAVPATPPPSSPPAAEGCAPSFVSQVCDPVCNTGCPPLSRCDVGADPGEGVCVGLWLDGESDRCWRTASADSCAPRLTCYSGRCRRLCYQDRDCTGTERCCNVDLPSGGDQGDQPASSGFKACGPCS